jgi:hypothetical protein
VPGLLDDEDGRENVYPIVEKLVEKCSHEKKGLTAEPLEVRSESTEKNGYKTGFRRGVNGDSGNYTMPVRFGGVIDDIATYRSRAFSAAQIKAQSSGLC